MYDLSLSLSLYQYPTSSQATELPVKRSDSTGFEPHMETDIIKIFP
jgi:hypothetical protein